MYSFCHEGERSGDLQAWRELAMTSSERWSASWPRRRASGPVAPRCSEPVRWLTVCKRVAVSLVLTAKGQVKLGRDLLQHLGIKPGERVDLEKLPGGELRLRAARPTGRIDEFLHSLAGKLSAGNRWRSRK